VEAVGGRREELLAAEAAPPQELELLDDEPSPKGRAFLSLQSDLFLGIRRTERTTFSLNRTPSKRELSKFRKGQ
jgi:hypothetical protein